MEKQIIQTFLYNKKQKFSDIEKQVKARSNKISYHLKNLIKKKILEKKGDFYQLTEISEILIPFISEKTSVLPVVLIALQNKNKIFLHKREKRPFKDKMSLPGGRLILGETILEATKRIMKEKFNLNAKFKKINSISLEQVKRKNKILHSFLLILVTAETKDKIIYLNPDKNKTISSDYNLIKNNLNKEIKIEDLITKIEYNNP
jgi:ADP-ribose pyrophosphatase YjhB (NUDIX family)